KFFAVTWNGMPYLLTSESAVLAAAAAGDVVPDPALATRPSASDRRGVTLAAHTVPRRCLPGGSWLSIDADGISAAGPPGMVQDVEGLDCRAKDVEPTQ